MNLCARFLFLSAQSIANTNGVAGLSGSGGSDISDIKEKLCGEVYGAVGRMQVFDEKASRTPAQKKIDSQLLYALKQKRGETRGIPNERIKIELDQRGRALVDITARVSPQVTSQIRKLGGIDLGGRTLPYGSRQTRAGKIGSAGRPEGC